MGAARSDLAVVAAQPRQLARRLRGRRARDGRVRPRARRVRARLHQRARRRSRAARPQAARGCRAARAPAVLPLPDQRRVGARSRRDLRDATDARRSRGSRVDFDYNAWGGKYPPFDLDRQIGRQMAEALGVPRYAKPGIVLEGGSIEVNGEGALLTTEQCLLNPNRNPSLTRADIETAAARLLRRHARSSGSARASRATTPTATSTTSRASWRPAPS